AERLENRPEAASLGRIGPLATRRRRSRAPLTALEPQAGPGVEHQTIAGAKRERLPGAQLPFAESSGLDHTIRRAAQRRDPMPLGEIESGRPGERPAFGGPRNMPAEGDRRPRRDVAPRAPRGDEQARADDRDERDKSQRARVEQGEPSTPKRDLQEAGAATVLGTPRRRTPMRATRARVG